MIPASTLASVTARAAARAASKAPRHALLAAAAHASRTQFARHQSTITSPAHLIPLYGRPEDVVLTHGKGALLWDSKGREYIDLTAGIAVCSLGHADAQVAEVLADQASKLVHVSNLFRNPWAEQLADQLVESAKRDYLPASEQVTLGEGKALSSVFFCNSGTEANEAAIKFARAHAPDPNKYRILTFSNAFHGRSMGALSATPNKKYQAPFEPLVPGFQSVAYNDLASARAALEQHKGEFCAIMLEPLQGEGGVWPADESFLQGLRALADEHGCILIFDEIQCGLSRTGRKWAHHWSKVTPDILTAAKPLGNGVPIGAVMVNATVLTSLAPASHGTTFGGNPLACRVGSHVLDRLTAPSLLAHVAHMESLVRDRLAGMQKAVPKAVTGSRGRGLIWGLELDKSIPDAGKNVVAAARKNGVLVCTAGKDGNVVRIVPPLTIEEKVLHKGLDAIEAAVQTLVK
ncbi:acetylornithine and succinylornithine aminotransferase [Allomyces macrogynus ATCC 38327]|uniref:acetylornithine transaminase n=1 Tax=Allomyces macrogynus (strain ATCC 38327) TaxID=578462 RepID=A0A0L0SEK8_ALLM3|nr:acetylornithine and succinylornithine aminotransferase [Allomyces macrogynus ATCC 38327]|eukprot:KNE60882.1 acetylornithine and succinylornithine aminotransferase [Allomyces macrogynus ATCC 38327]